MRVLRRKAKLAVKSNRRVEHKPNNKKDSKSTKKIQSETTQIDSPKNSGTIMHAAHALFRFAVMIAVTGAIFWGGKVIYTHATTSKYFALRYVAISGNHRLTKDEIMQTCNISLGENIFSIDAEKLSLKLQEHPWISSARVERRLPRTVSLEIFERRAEALVLFDVPYIIDNTGTVFKRWALKDPVPRPMITGFTREQLINDKEDVKSIILNAIALTEKYRSSGLDKRAPLSEIHREVDGGFSLTAGAGEGSFYVHMGVGPYRKKLTRLTKLLKKMKRDGKIPSVIFFDNEVRPDRVTVKIKQIGRAASIDQIKKSSGE